MHCQITHHDKYEYANNRNITHSRATRAAWSVLFSAIDRCRGDVPLQGRSTNLWQSHSASQSYTHSNKGQEEVSCLKEKHFLVWTKTETALRHHGQAPTFRRHKNENLLSDRALAHPGASSCRLGESHLMQVPHDNGGTS